MSNDTEGKQAGENQCIGVDINRCKPIEEILQKSEDGFRTIFEFAPIAIAIINGQGILLQTNQAFQELFGYTREELQNLHLSKFTHPDDRAESFNLFQELVARKRIHFSRETRYFRKDSCMLWGNVLVWAIYDANGSFGCAIAMFQDVSPQKQASLELQKAYDELEKRVTERTAELTQANQLLKQEIAERKLAQEALSAQKEFLQTVIDTNPNQIFVKDRDGKYVLVNQAFAEFHGTTVEDVLGKTDAQVSPAQAELSEFLAQDREVLATLQQQFIPEQIDRMPSGEICWFQAIKKPLFSSDGQVDQVLGVSTDITKRKLVEEELRYNEEQLRLALEATYMGNWEWNLKTGKITWSNQTERLYGFAPNTYDGTDEAFLARVHPEDRDRFQQCRQNIFENRDNCKDIEFRIILPDGSIRWMESKRQVIYDKTGKPLKITGIDLDITERKQAETQIKASLREKEVLLQEIHHRVKNNLQVISSLLDLQSQRINDKTTLEMFQESQNRIKLMALVHETLYEYKDFAKINFPAYLKSLTSYLFRAYKVATNHITLELDFDEIYLNLDKAVPCGLIISELVSNSLKYAFPNQTQGIIRISVNCDEGGDIQLIVRDNGIGFPTNWNFSSINSLGLQLVNVLINQIEGTLELNNSQGVQFKISFQNH